MAVHAGGEVNVYVCHKRVPLERQHSIGIGRRRENGRLYGRSVREARRHKGGT